MNPRFDEFWNAYPKHQDKKRTEDEYAKALVLASAEVIIEGAQRYAAEVEGRELRYIKSARSWLADRRWEDEQSVAAWVPPEGEEWMK